MTRNLPLCFLIIILFVSCLSLRQEEKIMAVSTQDQERTYYISFTTKNISSREFETLFYPKKITIKQVYPWNRLAIEDDRIMKNLETFHYYDNTTFEKQYIDVLRRYGLFEEMDKIISKGIPIRQIKVSATKEAMYQLKREQPKLIISRNKTSE